MLERTITQTTGEAPEDALGEDARFFVSLSNRFGA